MVPLSAVRISNHPARAAGIPWRRRDWPAVMSAVWSPAFPRPHRGPARFRGQKDRAPNGALTRTFSPWEAASQRRERLCTNPEVTVTCPDALLLRPHRGPAGGLMGVVSACDVALTSHFTTACPRSSEDRAVVS